MALAVLPRVPNALGLQGAPLYAPLGPGFLSPATGESRHSGWGRAIPGEHPLSSSHRTPRWRKADSNRWSHLRQRC